MSSKKETAAVVEAAKSQGWRCDDLGNLWKCYAPDGQTIVTVHKTTSDARAWRNTLARMKRVGLQWPPPGKGQ